MNQTGKRMILTTTMLMAGPVGASIIASKTFGDILVGAAGSLLAEQITSLKHVHFEKHVKAAYNKAIHKLEAEGYSQSLCDTLISLENLKLYATSGLPESDEVLSRLLSLWVNELHEDPNCSQYVVELKLGEVQTKIDNIANDIKVIQNTVEDTNEYLHRFRSKGFCNIQDVKGYIKRVCSEGEYFYLSDFLHSKSLEDYVITGMCNSGVKNHFALYASMQMGKSTELRHLAYILMNSNVFQPLLISVHNVPNLKSDDLPEDDMLNGKPFVLLIDAVDEADGGNVSRVLREIKSYAKHHPKMRIVISCRTNFRRDDLLPTFTPLTLHPLTINDIDEIIRKELTSSASYKLLQLISDNNLGEIVKNPQDLMSVIECFKKSGCVPSSRVELMEFFVDNHYNVEKEKGFKTFPVTKEEECRRLQRVAAIMLCSGKRELTDDEFRICLKNGEEELLEHMRFELVASFDGKVSFCNNIVMEYLAACFLASCKTITEVKKLVCYKDTEIFRPLWYSSLLLWVDLLRLRLDKDCNDKMANEAMKWMMINAQVLLYNSDLGLLSDEDKGNLMIASLEKCKESNTQFDGVVNDYSLRKLQLPRNLIVYIYDQWRTIEKVDYHLSNIANLTSVIDWDALANTDLTRCQELENELFLNLTKPLFDGHNKEFAFKALSNSHFFSDEFVKRIFDELSCKDGIDYIEFLTYRISGLDNVDQYTDYLLMAEEKLVDSCRSVGTKVVARDYVYMSLAKIQKPENIIKVLHCLANDHYWTFAPNMKVAVQTAEFIVERARALGDESWESVLSQAESRLASRSNPIVNNWDVEKQHRAEEHERREREMLCNHGVFVPECRSILYNPYRNGPESADIMKLLDPTINGRGEINRYVIEFLSGYVYRGEFDGKIIVNVQQARCALNSDKVYNDFRFLKLNEVKNNHLCVLPLTDVERNILLRHANQSLSDMCANPKFGLYSDVYRIVIEMLQRGELSNPSTENEWLALLSYASLPMYADFYSIDSEDTNRLIGLVLNNVSKEKVLDECLRLVTSNYAQASFTQYSIYAKLLLENGHRGALEFFEQIVMKDEKDSEEILVLLVKSNRLIDSIKANADRLSPGLLVYFCELLIEDSKHHEWIKTRFEPMYSNYYYPFIRRRLSLLYKLGSLNALRLTINNHHLLRSNDNDIFCYREIASIELLAKMFNLCITKNVFYIEWNSILDSLSEIAFSSKKALEEVKSLFCGKNRIIRSWGEGNIPEKWAHRLDERYRDYIQPVLSVQEAKDLIMSL